MKLAFSNLAWEPSQDREVATLLRGGNVSAVEIAPSKVWSDPTLVSASTAKEYRSQWEGEGLPICAMQSLLYGHPELTLFDSRNSRQALLTYLRSMLQLAEYLGAKKVVFGSPKNRRKAALTDKEALQTAVPFFQKLGALALDRGVTVCIEANAREYGCDFITTSGEASALVTAVGSAGFQLHLDWGCMDLAKEPFLENIRKFGSKAAHFHLSSRNLEPVIDRKGEQVKALIQIFSDVRSNATASVEMLNPGGNLETIGAVLAEFGSCFESR